MQIKIVEMKHILLWYIIGKKKSEKRVERMKKREREWEEELFFLFLEMYITGDRKPFYRFFKWLSLIYPLMNINENHK